MNDDVNIVVVDDNEIDLMIGKRLISRVNSNIKVETFSSICEVISWVNSEKDYFKKNNVVFFIDIYLPNGNGFKLSEDIFKRISDIKEKNSIFYLLSATIDDVDLRKVKNSDLIKGFIGKPLTVDIINQVINEEISTINSFEYSLSSKWLLKLSKKTQLNLKYQYWNSLLPNNKSYADDHQRHHQTHDSDALELHVNIHSKEYHVFRQCFLQTPASQLRFLP